MNERQRNQIQRKVEYSLLSINDRINKQENN